MALANKAAKAAFGTTAARPARRGAVAVRAAALKIPDAYTKVMPKGDLVLAKVAATEEKTTGGILLPGSAQKKPTSGDVVALGDGHVEGKTRPFELAVGNTILYSKYGMGITDLELAGEEHILLREDDVIGVMPRSNATADDIPELRPCADRVLIKVQETADVTMGGVILPDSAKERPLSGTVVRTGPGKLVDGERKPCNLQAGERVIFFKYAGEQMETPSGDKYVVVREADCLARL